ncbi:MAG: galactokinase [Clostridia bacterium]|nr:galactokinase [Clostridia bacterium]
MTAKELLAALEAGTYDSNLSALYSAKDVNAQRSRYLEAVKQFAERYGEEREVSVFTVAGRSEISGNHTDHNLGCVIAASINLDIIAVASKRDDTVIHVKSEGFPEDVIDYREDSILPKNYFSSGAIITGVCRGFLDRKHRVCGFDAFTTSNVLKGSGLSSSAAFEDMIGTILNWFSNGGKIGFTEIAQISQFAENKYFGKPCGLMDQVACAAGGFVSIDFADPKQPVVEKFDFDLTGKGYALCIVNTGGNHADLNEDYASVPAEMKQVAAYFGEPVLRPVTMDQLIPAIPDLRKSCGDRAILRAIHYIRENQLVMEQMKALKSGDMKRFLQNEIASGDSSFKYLQNVYTTKNVSEQGLSLALALSQTYLADREGAWRVHGGGFAGTTQAFVRTEDVEGYRAIMNSVFGEGACIVLQVRSTGAGKVI